jgi:hypothetical protein
MGKFFKYDRHLLKEAFRHKKATDVGTGGLIYYSIILDERYLTG